MAVLFLFVFMYYFFIKSLKYRLIDCFIYLYLLYYNIKRKESFMLTYNFDIKNFKMHYLEKFTFQINGGNIIECLRLIIILKQVKQ